MPVHLPAHLHTPPPLIPGLTATDLFAGGGGASAGLRNAGIHTVVAANHWPLAIATHKRNHPDTEHRCKDLSEIDWRTFPRTLLLWASPSCVWHARAGGRKAIPLEQELLRTDPGAIDRATALAVIEAAEVHLYPVILVENVPEFRKWKLYPWWLDGLRALGYTVTELLLNAADYGHAQHRIRTIVVATRGVELDLTPPTLAPVHADAILDPHHGNPVTRRLYVTPQIAEIPDHLDRVPHLVMMRKHAHARRADRHPIATVTAGGNHHMLATLVDGQPHARLLTNRERARAQGFHDSYEFAGGADDVRKQIGNAVPTGIARWLGERAAHALGHQPVTHPAIAA